VLEHTLAHVDGATDIIIAERLVPENTLAHADGAKTFCLRLRCVMKLQRTKDYNIYCGILPMRF
jgi:hypothetical protein